MPKRQWAPWISLVSRLSRVLAQEACFTTSTLRPYCLKRPSSEAMTSEAQSVRAMKPSLIGSLLVALRTAVGEPAGTAAPAAGEVAAGGLAAGVSAGLQAASKPGVARAAPEAAISFRKRRRSRAARDEARSGDLGNLMSGPPTGSGRVS